MRTPVPHAALAIALSMAPALPTVTQTQEPKPFTDRVDVERVLLDVRVTDGRGQPLEDLAKADFVVRIDGKPARVESATWVTGALRRQDTVSVPAGSAAAV